MMKIKAGKWLGLTILQKQVLLKEKTKKQQA